MRLIFFKDKSIESIFECGGMNFPLCSSVRGRSGVVPFSNVILSFLVHVLTSSSPNQMTLVPSVSSASMAGDFRKRRKSEPAVGPPRGLGDQSASRTSPSRADLPGSSSTFTKSFISSSPSSPSRAQGEPQ